jgi:DNA-binding NarL/FixJ family response regulator
MNAISTKFAVFENFEHEALLGTLPVRGHVQTERRSGRLAAIAGTLRSGENGDGRSLAEALRERYPSSPVVVLFLADHSDEALRAIGLREIGCIQGPGSDEGEGSRARPAPPYTERETAPTGRDAAAAANDSSPARRTPTARGLGLTQRQMEVLALMLQGKPNKLICRELRLAEGTVKCHVSAILRVLEVGSRTQAALKAARLGLGGDRIPA